LKFEDVLRSKVRRWVLARDAGSALKSAANLYSRGIVASLNYLGEKTRDEGVVLSNLEEYLRLIRQAKKGLVRADVSVKPSQLGALVGPSTLEENLRQLLDELGDTVATLSVDAEDEKTNELSWPVLRALILDQTGLTLTVQAHDENATAKVSGIMEAGGRVRLCKGAYGGTAPPHDLLERLVLSILKTSPAPKIVVATNSPRIVRLLSVVALGQPFEIEPLQGTHRRVEDLAVAAGLRIRRYVPFGENWLPYCKRRDPWFAENETKIVTLRSRGRI